MVFISVIKSEVLRSNRKAMSYGSSGVRQNMADLKSSSPQRVLINKSKFCFAGTSQTYALRSQVSQSFVLHCRDFVWFLCFKLQNVYFLILLDSLV
jgi:hypothetical protein